MGPGPGRTGLLLRACGRRIRRRGCGSLAGGAHLGGKFGLGLLFLLQLRQGGNLGVVQHPCAAATTASVMGGPLLRPPNGPKPPPAPPEVAGCGALADMIAITWLA